MFLNQGSGFGPLSRVRVQSKVVQGPKDWCPVQGPVSRLQLGCILPEN